MVIICLHPSLYLMEQTLLTIDGMKQFICMGRGPLFSLESCTWWRTAIHPLFFKARESQHRMFWIYPVSLMFCYESILTLIIELLFSFFFLACQFLSTELKDIGFVPILMIARYLANCSQTWAYVAIVTWPILMKKLKSLRRFYCLDAACRY